MPGIEVTNGISGKRLVALTYDDGPTYPEATREIVEVLQKAGVRATFFVRGCMAVVNRQSLNDLQAAGMEIGNHTFNHQNLSLFDPSNPSSKEFIKDEIIRAHLAVEDLIGVSMRHFRPPWGGINDFVRGTMNTDPALVRFNYNRILWSVDSRDWTPGSEAGAIVEQVTKAPNLDGAIVLMHDGADRFYKLRAKPTVAASRRLVPALIDQGFVLVTVSELLAGSGVTLL
jgi:peptidoglycan/xylan/chitin deacetylase (PgdA/CDA1 family)